MRCIRPESRSGRERGSVEPCERCRRNKRQCIIPEPRPLGRRHGAVGRYKGVEKAFRKMRSELQKAHASGEELPDIPGLSGLITSNEDVRDLINLEDSSKSLDSHSRRPSNAGLEQLGAESQLDVQIFQDDHVQPIASPLVRGSTESVPFRQNEEPISNPLGLVAGASGEARAQDEQCLVTDDLQATGPCIQSPVSEGGPQNLARKLLRRRGYISLGLKISKESLETGLDSLFAYPGLKGRYADYFKPSENAEAPDTGPDLDPVELGLVTIEEAHHLFPM